MSEREHQELTPEEQKENVMAVVAHVLPFAIWLTLMVYFENYVVRTVSGLVLLAVARPWRWYPRLQLKNIPAAIAVGVLIFFVWVGFETPWMAQKAPAVAEWYDRLFVDLMHPFKTRELFDVPAEIESDAVQEAILLGEENIERTRLPFEVIESGPHVGRHIYDPRVTGLFVFWVHMFGTSVIIAIIEEFFFRGFLYRWMMGSPFFKIDPGRLHWPMLLVISVFFGVEHYEWMAGIICGIAFGLLYIKTQDIWAAIIAHGTTNFILGLYVVQFNAYEFW
ncbi:MAG: CAAX prenyl protease-related protein [Pontiellaceae bacterium]|nr:CAAX prenyl protease-related protein [Pontiellaceae bacterium]MBN2786512.1 CAAX prenyl protease-related protein [Pontiellaceae bacterium]